MSWALIPWIEREGVSATTASTDSGRTRMCLQFFYHIKEGFLYPETRQIGALSLAKTERMKMHLVLDLGRRHGLGAGGRSYWLGTGLRLPRGHVVSRNG